MPPVRVGIIGLSVTAKTSWASNAHLPYLLSDRNKYVIVALCNSSAAAAQKAIDTYRLPRSTRAYGSPEDLADDKEVDLVVCCVRVDKHYDTIRPSLERGKDVFVEWPLGSNVKEAKELDRLAREKGVKNMVGLQGRVSPLILRVKSLLAEQKIGKVLSSTLVTWGGTKSRDSITEGLKYFMDRSVGGNVVTIGFAHMIDYVNYTLGEFSSLKAELGIQRPQVDLLDQNGTVTETVKSDVPDYISVNGKLALSGAPISITYRRGPPFKGDTAFLWYIHGETGEIKVSASGPALQAAAQGNNIIELHNFSTDEVKTVEWQLESELPLPAQNVGRLYDAFVEDEVRYPQFKDAVTRHTQIEEILRSSEENKAVQYI